MIIFMVRDYIKISGLRIHAKKPQGKPENGCIAQNKRGFSKGVCQGETSCRAPLCTPQGTAQQRHGLGKCSHCVHAKDFKKLLFSYSNTTG